MNTETKLGPITNFAKKNTATSKNWENVMSAIWDVIVIFPIYGQFYPPPSHPPPQEEPFKSPPRLG